MNEILSHYGVLKNCRPPQPFGNGHINNTYLVTSPEGEFILQRVNKNVFDTAILTKNLSFLYGALYDYEKKTGKKLTPAIYTNSSGNFHTLDKEGAAWRLIEFFSGCQSYAISPDENISYHAAKAMGEFQLFLNTLPVEEFGETIKGFHNTPGRLKTFLKTVEMASASLKSKAKTEIRFAKKHQDIAHELKQLLNSGKLPLHVTHNDTKLDNILFTADEQVLIIDLDTIMPGYVMYDYGDMVRTFTSPAKEDEQDNSKPKLRPEHFAALTKGYLDSLKRVLSQEEKTSLLLGAKAIIYEQALRFLNDYLLGNVYYKTSYPEHNLVRTRTQIRLLEDLLKQENALLKLINDV